VEFISKDKVSLKHLDRRENMQQKMEDVAAIVAALEAQKKKPIIGSAKTITLFILVAAFVFGVYGSFDKANFNMAEYVTFLESFAWFFAPLIISIGAGSATKSIAEKKNNHTEEH
jgi:hypothetical protein